MAWEGVAGGARFALARKAGQVLAVGGVALLAANCGAPQQTARGVARPEIDPKYGVAPSPRVVEEGSPIPKGGGREHIGKPYRIAGRTYVPRDVDGSYSRIGLASWYGAAFHGRRTANGEIFDRLAVGAAHPTLPLPSYVRVTNLKNNHSMIVRVNDRGPYHGNRIIDVSQRVAEALDFKRDGTARVRVEYVGRASVRGSDDLTLLATLRTDGGVAAFPGATAPVLVASADTIVTGPGPIPFTPRPQITPSLPRNAAHVEVAAVPAAAPVKPVVVAYAPLPPERPFDLEPAPTGARRSEKPAPSAALPPRRPSVAGLFYAEPTAASAGFERGDPFTLLKPQRFIPLRPGV